MKLKKDYTDYIESVCKKKTLKELKKIVKYLDQGDTISVAREKRTKNILEKKEKVVQGIKEITEVSPTIKKIDLEKQIMKKYEISRSTFYKYLKEIKM